MMMIKSSADKSERSRFNFVEVVAKHFCFLRELGFVEVERLPTFVRYRKGDLEIQVYHGRQSYEIGLELGSHGVNYSISELIRVTDPGAAEEYRNYVATSPEGVTEGVVRLENLLKRYGEQALRNDLEIFKMLERGRKLWAEEYALDVLADQLRPKADAAFRGGDYHSAAELYEKIRARLSDAELKKLALAKDRSGRAR